MTDNTTLNAGSGGDVIRDLARTTGPSSGTKTQVVQLDFGGANTNAESLVSASNGLPVYQTAALPAGTNIIGTVLGPLPAAPVAGQQTLTLAAAALPSNALQNGIVITAMATNTGTVYVGPSGVSATTGYPLLAGQSVSLALANSSGAYIIGTNTTDKIAFAGN